MKLSLIALLLALTTAAQAVMVVDPPKRSPSTGEASNAELIDEAGRRLPLWGVVYPDANGATGLDATRFVKGTVSSVTAKEEPPRYRTAAGYELPMMALSVIDPATNLPVPYTVPSGAVTNVGGSTAAAVNTATIAANYPSGTAATSQLRYVQKNGSDSNDCTLLKPCLTPEFTESLITDAANSKQYNIMFGPGTYILTAGFVKKNNIFWTGVSRRDVKVNVGALDPGFGLNVAVAATGSVSYTSIQFIGVTYGLHFTQTNSAFIFTASLHDVVVRTPVGVIVDGAGSGSTTLEMHHSDLLGSAAINSAFLFATGSYFGDRITADVNSALVNTPVVVTGNTSIGDNHITSMSSTAGLTSGMTVSGLGIPVGTLISFAGQPPLQVLLNQNATSTNVGASYSFTKNLSSLLDIFHSTFSGVTVKKISTAIIGASHNQSTLILNDGGSSINSDPEGIINSGNVTADPGTILNRLTFATALGYVPSVSGNWSVVPTEVGSALNTLAADKLDRSKLLTFDSAASAGGAGSEALVVTGLLATDTILSVSQRVAGANGTAQNGWSGQANNALTVAWTGDPGAGAIVRVAVKR